MESKSVESKKKWQGGEYQSMTKLVDTERQNQHVYRNSNPSRVYGASRNLLTKNWEKLLCAVRKRYHQNVQNHRFLKARDQYVRFRFCHSGEDALRCMTFGADLACTFHVIFKGMPDMMVGTWFPCCFTYQQWTWLHYTWWHQQKTDVWKSTY